jgi:hypothetical protein
MFEMDGVDNKKLRSVVDICAELMHHARSLLLRGTTCIASFDLFVSCRALKNLETNEHKIRSFDCSCNASVSRPVQCLHPLCETRRLCHVADAFAFGLCVRRTVTTK